MIRVLHRRTHHLLHLAAILAAATAGCGDSALPPVDAGVDASADLSPPMIYFRSVMLDFSYKPLPGVAVSVVGHPEIAPVMSDQTGSFAIPVPGNQVVQIELDKDTFVPTVTRPLTIGTADFGIIAIPLITTATADALAAFFNLMIDPSKGLTSTIIYGPDGKPLSGATAAINPATGSNPIYFSAGNFPDPSLTQTSSSGYVAFINYAPGPATFTVTHPMYPHCVSEGPDMPSPVPLQFLAGEGEAFGAVYCSP